MESERYVFKAPLGPIELNEIRWYLEDYALWPTGVFEDRAQRLEGHLPQWGKELYEAALGAEQAQAALNASLGAATGVERRLSVFVDGRLPAGSAEEDEEAAREAASTLLALPWELLRDADGYLFKGKLGVRVRRRLPSYRQRGTTATELPIRVLLVAPRPEDKRTRYIDYRASALPLVEALEELGELVELTVLRPPAFGALEEALKRAAEAGEPFDVIHFNGHGVWNRELGLGALCFEDPRDTDRLTQRRMALVSATDLAETMRDYRVPLVFLEACQSAKVEDDPTASVAAQLLEQGGRRWWP